MPRWRPSIQIGAGGRTRFEERVRKKRPLKAMVHPSERSCNYAEGGFDGRKLSILPLFLSLNVHVTRL